MLKIGRVFILDGWNYSIIDIGMSDKMSIALA